MSSKALARTAGPQPQPFYTSIALWIDLLGYGDMISKADFNPFHPAAKAVLHRACTFHEVVARHSRIGFPTLVMNDGAVAYRDLPRENREVGYRFLMRAWKLYQEVSEAETAAGHPGARLVMATGFRVRGRRAGLDATAEGVREVLEQVQNGDLDLDEAVKAVARARARFDIIPQLQANFAFTKAYVADQSGSRSGLGGPAFHVDKALFKPLRPDCVRIGAQVSWRHRTLNLSADFLQVLDITKHKKLDALPQFQTGSEIGLAATHSKRWVAGETAGRGAGHA